MSKARGAGPAPNRDINEGLLEFLSGAARLLMYAGILATIIGVGFLGYTCFAFSGSSKPPNPESAIANVGVLEKFLYGGVLALGVSTTFLFWGESILAALQILGGAILFFSPLILNFAGISSSSNGSDTVDPVSVAQTSLSHGGVILGIIGLIVLGADLAVRAKERSQQGWKLDQLRYGKGVKEEVDRHNVFLGKCWQLPFCRKFVRERCPIYHARRTCWKELTGCMCEEEVIRNAMENKAIPKDALMAATYIPRNLKLTVAQKQERCRTCVIYNEHQKHKYKLLMPTTLVLFGGVYFLAHGPLINLMSTILNALDRMIGRATYERMHIEDQPVLFQELLLACIMVILLAYAMKLLEYIVFKLKV